MATDFNIAVSERFLASVPITGSSPVTGFPLGPFQECTVAIGSDPVLTGYIDNYLPEVEADRHAVRVTGRSKTEDIARHSGARHRTRLAAVRRFALADHTADWIHGFGRSRAGGDAPAGSFARPPQEGLRLP